MVHPPTHPSRTKRVHQADLRKKKKHKMLRNHMLVSADMLMCCTTGTDEAQTHK